MSITLKHLSGFLKGQEQTFDDDKTRIVVGRDASQCDLVFPADMTLVGREHCALVRQPSGEYEVDLFGEHYVEVDGQPALAEAAVTTGTVLTLGRHDGPRLEARVDRSNVSADLAKTRTQQKPPSLWSMSRTTRLVAGGAVALALILGVGLFLQHRQVLAEQAESASLLKQMGDIVAQEKAQAAQAISLAERQHLAQSVYAVIVRDASGAERLLGTSWAAGPHELATNAHVAKEFLTLKPGEALVVRPPGAADVGSIVKSVAIHPGYDAFDKFVNDDALLVKNYGGWDRVQTIGGYDVALLKVDDTIPADVILPIADGDELKTLKAGDPLAYAGFPYENIEGNNLQPLGRTPQVQVGSVTAMTDYFLLPADFDQRRLVEHNLPATGGASGSPMIDAAGHVVALLSDINMTSLKKDERIPSAALINYGQRVDVLSDLMNGDAEKRTQADLAYWKRQTAGFKSGADFVIANVVDKVQEPPGTRAELVGSADYEITKDYRFTSKGDDGKPFTSRIKLVHVDMQPGSHHLVVVYGKGFAPIALLSLVEDGKIVDTNKGQGDPWAGINFTAPDDGKVTLLIGVADTDIDVVLRDYLWTTAAPQDKS